MNQVVTILINYGVIGIAICGFAESLFLPFPMELVFISVSLGKTKNALFYSIILVFCSTLGAFLGYFIGRKAGSPILNKFLSPKQLEKTEKLYNKNSFLTITTSSFTPIPFEAYVLTAGAFNVRFLNFITAVFISRTIKYLLEGTLITLYGESLIYLIRNYTIVVAIVLFLIIFLLNYIFKKTLNKCNGFRFEVQRQ